MIRPNSDSKLAFLFWAVSQISPAWVLFRGFLRPGFRGHVTWSKQVMWYIETFWKRPELVVCTDATQYTKTLNLSWDKLFRIPFSVIVTLSLAGKHICINRLVWPRAFRTRKSYEVMATLPVLTRNWMRKIPRIKALKYRDAKLSGLLKLCSNLVTIMCTCLASPMKKKVRV